MKNSIEMAKRTIILSEDQLDEIGIIGYCSGGDFKNNGATEVSVSDNLSGSFGRSTTTDDIANQRVSDIGGLWKDGGACRNVVMREGVFEQLKAFINEDNDDLKDRSFTISPTDSEILSQAPEGSAINNLVKHGYKGERMPELSSSSNNALKKAINGDTSTAIEMFGTDNIDIIGKMNKKIQDVYTKDKKNSLMRRNAKPEGQKIKSAPKQSGNGKAHSKKDEPIITYED